MPEGVCSVLRSKPHIGKRIAARRLSKACQIASVTLKNKEIGAERDHSNEQHIGTAGGTGSDVGPFHQTRTDPVETAKFRCTNDQFRTRSEERRVGKECR